MYLLKIINLWYIFYKIYFFSYVLIPALAHTIFVWTRKNLSY
jgi:hypothetical protein